MSIQHINSRDLGKKYMLVADDSATGRDLVREIFRDDFLVLEAADGKEAFQVLKERYQDISVVLLDLIMPQYNGFWFLEQVRKDPFLAAVPVIAITGNAGREAEERCLEMGVVDFMTKPILPMIMRRRVRNIVRLRESVSALQEVEIDELTGLYTRQAFYHHAKQLLDANPDKEYDLTIGDVENFKMINSIYGEAKGDEVLAYLGAYLKANTAEGGLCARYGGDKFIGFAEADPNRKKGWLLELIRGLKADAPVPDIVLNCGVYASVDKSLSVSAMCDRALLAVKSIKHNYTMPYATYDGPVSRAHLRAQMFESRFDSAIRNHEFLIYYQPKVDVVTEQVVGSEALVRWIMTDGTFVSPGEFIPTFEEDGLVVRLDEYVFREVCERIADILTQNVPVFPISVNLSRASLYQEGCVERYRRIIEETGIPKYYVPLELTESATIDGERIRELMQELKDAGFSLHMDDFGSGVSSLASIDILPFDVLKLDKSLVDLIGNEGGNEIIRHTIELAHFEKMSVVAEGVEKKEQVEFLRRLHCDTIQGYYYSAPKSYEDVIEYFRTHLGLERKQQDLTQK